ncbi:hypothetical protein A2U01_0040537, partial [Trifolium medium]|nr:hypothetical protein [Trifolium medium]
TICRLPSQAGDSVATRDHISAQFAEYLDRVLKPEQRGLAGIHPWDAAPGYTRWYFRISHLYMMPLPLGDPPRPWVTCPERCAGYMGCWKLCTAAPEEGWCGGNATQ